MLKKLGVQLLLERPARKASLPDLAQRLEESGYKISARLKTLPESDRNRIVLRHIIGIERWGQRRLRTAFGEPFLNEEYDGYKPDKSTAWERLQTEFAETRRHTVTLIHDLNEAKVNTNRKIPHNSYGDLTLRGWIRYLEVHAGFESKKIK